MKNKEELLSEIGFSSAYIDALSGYKEIEVNIEDFNYDVEQIAAKENDVKEMHIDIKNRSTNSEYKIRI